MGGGGTHRPSMPRNLWEPWVGHTLGPTCEEPMPSNLEESATEGHYIYHGKPRKTTKGHGRSRQATGGHGRSRDTMGHHVKPLYLTRNHRSMLSLGSILGPPTDQSFCGRPCVTYCMFLTPSMILIFHYELSYRLQTAHRYI